MTAPRAAPAVQAEDMEAAIEALREHGLRASAARLGLVRHLHLGHGPGLHGRAGLGAREHLICDARGTHTAVDPADLDPVRDLVRSRFGQEASFAQVPIGGLCPDCARRSGGEEGPERGA